MFNPDKLEPKVELKTREKDEEKKIEKKEEPVPKDISTEFLAMTLDQFERFLRTQDKERVFLIKIDWQDIWSARRLKDFVGAAEAVVGGKRKRFATIRATEEQYKQELNVFASGVKWEKVEQH